MTASVLVDMDILIDASRKLTTAVDFLDVLEREGSVGISLITKLELMSGCRNKRELRTTERFLRRFVVISLGQDVGNHAERLFREYRLSHGLMIPDCLIAATAIALNLPLATKNRRDFLFIDGLMLRPYGENR